MEDNSLDNFLSNTSVEEKTPTQETGGLPQRPKLRKIKRPKQRVTADIPQAPQKENFVEVSDSSEIENVNLSTSESQSDYSTQSTDLITSSEANNVTANNVYDSQYVLDGLPPELDYITDDILDENIDTHGYVKKNVLVVVSILFLFIGVFAGKSFVFL